MNNYTDYRDKIKSGDIVATSVHGVHSLGDLQTQIVRLFTKSEYSHTALVWKCSGRLFLIESTPPYVRIRPLSHLKEFYHISLKSPMNNKELEYALSQVGVGEYSRIQAIKGFLETLKIGEDSTWQCAEFVIKCRSISGVNLGSTATPSAVVEEALKQGYSINYVKNGE